MTRGFLASDSAARLVPAHYAIAGLALLAVIVVQANWDGSLGATPTSISPAYRVAIIIVSTAWLLSTAWLHSAIARRRRNPLVLASRRAASHGLADLLIAAVAGRILLQGHHSPLAAASLWAVSPSVVAIAIPSAILLAISAFWNRRLLPVAPPPKKIDLVRFAIALVMLATLFLGSSPTSH